MSDSASFYHRFFLDVSVGFLLTVFGAVLLLAAAVDFSRRPEPVAGERLPSSLRVLSAGAFLIFLVGIAWQVIGYGRYIRW